MILSRFIYHLGPYILGRFSDYDNMWYCVSGWDNFDVNYVKLFDIPGITDWLSLHIEDGWYINALVKVVVQVMACHLFGSKPSHQPVLTLCYYTTCFRHLYDGRELFPKNTFEYIVYKMVAIWTQLQCFNASTVQIEIIQFVCGSWLEQIYYIPRIRRIGGCYGFTWKPPAARRPQGC